MEHDCRPARIFEVLHGVKVVPKRGRLRNERVGQSNAKSCIHGTSRCDSGTAAPRYEGYSGQNRQRGAVLRASSAVQSSVGSQNSQYVHSESVSGRRVPGCRTHTQGVSGCSDSATNDRRNPSRLQRQFAGVCAAFRLAAIGTSARNPATRGPPEILLMGATFHSLCRVTVCSGIFRGDDSQIPLYRFPASDEVQSGAMLSRTNVACLLQGTPPRLSAAACPLAVERRVGLKPAMRVADVRRLCVSPVAADPV